MHEWVVESDLYPAWLATVTAETESTAPLRHHPGTRDGDRARHPTESAAAPQFTLA